MLSAILILSFLIFFHELGHFIMAKVVKVKVEVFSIGFGKKLFCKKIKDTNWCLSAIPLGGYVQMKGQDDSNPLQKSDEPDSYNAKSPWQRILILMGGPGFNFLLAILIYFFIAITGWQKLAPIIGKTIPNTPAAKVLKPKDKIIEINGIKIKSWDDIKKALKNSEIIDIKILRNNKILEFHIKPKIQEVKNIFGERVKRKIIGIVPSGDIVTIKYSFFDAIKVSIEKFLSDATLIIKGVEKLITGAVGLNNLSGPIGIVDITAKVANLGIQPLLLLMALLSVNLGILNLLPIPALDGGHIIFNLYEAIFKKELDEEIMIKLTIAGWIFLGILMIIGVYNDLMRIFN